MPFAYVETYRVADDPLAAHYDARPGRPRLARARRRAGVPRHRRVARARPLVVERLLEDGERVVCEPDVRNARMLAFCRALGGEVRAELELPDKRAALVVWER